MQLHRLDSGSSDPHARGGEYGAALGGVISSNVAGYSAFWSYWELTPEEVRRFGGAVGERIADWAPAVWSELSALAEAAGLPTEQIFALTGRTELLCRTRALASECSTVAVVDDRGARSAQTWDWYPALARDGVIRQRPAPDGGELRLFTEPGMLAKIGAAPRLGLHLNILSHRLDGAGVHGAGDPADVGVPVHVVAHEILSRAGSLAEAVAIAESAPLTASTVLTLVTPHEAACLELSPAGVRVVPADDGFLWHTNHFRHPDLVPDDTVETTGTTWGRGALLEQQHDALVGADTAGELLTHMCHTPVWVHPDPSLPDYERSATMLTAAFDYPLDATPTATFGHGPA